MILSDLEASDLEEIIRVAITAVDETRAEWAVATKRPFTNKDPNVQQKRGVRRLAVAMMSERLRDLLSGATPVKTGC